jgi:hypothetical protein
MWRPSAKTFVGKVARGVGLNTGAACARVSYVEQFVVGKLRPLLDELEARFRLVAH